ncbi:ATP-binding protein [Bacillus sp. DX1.1]|uniref:ATP-binding protein n=1 Tax=unclassified Bacillus (in: firmicutes) TaxID=185979 RepID=UPI002570A1AE|nr:MULTISPECIES: ATP-binding protein [unclassified Bacillus (in: firmicutes)]MDM5157260.1 ATP-binding protein [Bacillus sp. DX1.1]WJE81487.1 ATP-binding protein [Bacillus sp. DX3.1]
MRRILDMTKTLFGVNEMNLNREIIKAEPCKNCGRELKTYRVKLVGGPNKGKCTAVTEECSCYLAKQALETTIRTKIKYFKELSTINHSLINATLQNYSPHNDSQSHAVKRAIEFIEQLAQNKIARAIYYGESGLGKSHLSVGISKIVETKLQKTCLFLEVPTLKHMIKSSWSKDSVFTELEIMRAIAEVDLLILDDLGAEGDTPWTKELLFTILNSRLSKSLLVTTNLEIEDIYLEYGPKITDRLIQGMSKQNIIKIQGRHSYRLKELLEDDW